METYIPQPEREPRIPLAGDLLSEAREVASAALEFTRRDGTDDRMRYRALYAADRLGVGGQLRRADVFRLLSQEELAVLADCGELVIARLEDRDEALRRKARRLIEMALDAA